MLCAVVGSVTTMTAQVRRLLLAIAAIACGLLALAPGAAPALEVGIADSNAGTVDEPHWGGLGINRIRLVVPYDVALMRPDARRRREFEALRASANAKGVHLFVVFGPSVEVRAPDGYPLAPSVDEFGAAFAAFRQLYPEITTFGPWNEPNNPDASQYPLSWNPQLAADYWHRAQALCPTCTIVAGNFAGIVNDDWFVDAYLARLGGAVPAVWSFHAHGDVNSFQAEGPDDARVARYYLGKLQGQWAGGRIWIDEIGARFRDGGGYVWGDESQALATQFLLGIASLDPRIDAIYYYNYSNQCAQASRCAIQDRGLVSPAPFSGEPPGYDAFNRPRAAFGVIAARGPVIVPAQTVPPVVTIDTPAQSSAVNRSTPVFSGRAAVGGRAAREITLDIYPGTGATQSATTVQSLTAPVNPATGTWSVRVPTPLADGVYTAEASQVGNRSSSGVSQDTVFTVDTVAPTARITGGPRGSVTGSRVATFRFASSEPTGARFTCAIDGGAYAPCASPLTLRRMRLGRHTLSVKAVDLAGNVQRTPTRRRWTVVSLATALAPRTADLAAALDGGGIPLAASCADACRVGARLYVTAATARATGLSGRRVSRTDPARPRGKGYVTVGSASVVRKRAGSSTLALRLRAPRGAAIRGAGSVTVRLGFVLRGKRSRQVTVSRRVTLVRRGALRRLAADGLPVTVACTSACSQRSELYVTGAVATRLRARGRTTRGGGRTGLPRGRYVALGAASASRSLARADGGIEDVTIALPASVRRRLPRLASAGVRVAARAGGPGTPTRTLGWPLVLAR